MYIVLTRPKLASQELADILTSEAGGGHRCLVAPMLDIVTLEPSCNFGKAKAVIVSSSNGVQAAEHLAGIAQAKSLPLYCVGARTSALAQELGWQNIAGVGSTMVELTDLLCEGGLTGRFLYLAGVDRAQEMGMLLRASAIKLDTCEVYQAQAAKVLAEDFVAAVEKIEAVTLFSVRTAMIFLRLVEAQGFGKFLRQKKIICLSQSIAGRCIDAGYSNVAFPEAPTRAALIALINR